MASRALVEMPLIVCGRDIKHESARDPSPMPSVTMSGSNAEVERDRAVDRADHGAGRKRDRNEKPSGTPMRAFRIAISIDVKVRRLCDREVEVARRQRNDERERQHDAGRLAEPKMLEKLDQVEEGLGTHCAEQAITTIQPTRWPNRSRLRRAGGDGGRRRASLRHECGPPHGGHEFWLCTRRQACLDAAPW